VYPIAFGDLFGSESDLKPVALTFLQQLAFDGKTSTNPLAPLPSEQIITGPYQTRITNIRTAFERILQNGVQVTLVE
jgi:hypothetical protein